MNIIEAIKERRSVRSYNGESLSSKMIQDLQKAIEESYTLFGGKLTIRLKSFDLKDGFKPSTYGFIKGATDFFLLGMGEDEKSALTAGFQFEQVVLKAWQLGLGTCWIAGTFKGTDFGKDEVWPDGETLKIVSPVGVAEKPRLLEKVGRAAMGSDKRLPFEKLFFENDFNTPLSHNNKFAESLEMLRLAPSSTNSQPWRALVKEDRVLFYYKPKSKISVVDCGIGICHFYETEKYNHYSGVFEKQADYPEPIDNWNYLISYTRK